MVNIPQNNDMYEIVTNTIIIIYHAIVYKFVLYDFAVRLTD
jgi:hypothetical protein